MKTRDFLLVLIVVAVVALLLFRSDNAEAPDSTPTPKATQAAGPSPTPEATTPDEPHVTECLEDIENTDTYQIPDPPQKTEELLAKGGEIYQANCALCHGNEMAGDGDAGKVLDPAPTDLRSSKYYKYGSAPRNIYRDTAYGIEGTGMAPWDGILSPEEMWAVSFYVESQIDPP